MKNFVPKGNPSAKSGLGQNTAATALARNTPKSNGNNTPLGGKGQVGTGTNPNIGKSKLPG
jgi:hypothetical protein